MAAMAIAAFKSVTPHLSSTINKAEGIRFGNRIGLEQFPPAFGLIRHLPAGLGWAWSSLEEGQGWKS
jgi:hypothetical protein